MQKFQKVYDIHVFRNTLRREERYQNCLVPLLAKQQRNFHVLLATILFATILLTYGIEQNLLTCGLFLVSVLEISERMFKGSLALFLIMLAYFNYA